MLRDTIWKNTNIAILGYVYRVVHFAQCESCSLCERTAKWINGHLYGVLFPAALPILHQLLVKRIAYKRTMKGEFAHGKLNAHTQVYVHV